jgi:hypothetical protein
MDEIHTTYFLGIVDSSSLRSIRQLTKEEYQENVARINELTKFSLNDQLFNIVELNYEEIIISMNGYLDRYNQSPRANMLDEMPAIYLDMNRLLLNMLSSVRTYLDHTETRFNRTYGKLSAEFKLFKDQTSTAYDGEFAYRFLEKLRNFAQHCGLPAGRVRITSSADEDGNPINRIALLFDKDDLIAKFDGWGNVKTELGLLEKEFEVIPLIQSKNNMLKSINGILGEMELSKYKSDGEELQNLISETLREVGIPCIVELSGTGEEATINCSWFPFQIINRIQMLK